MTQEDIDTMEKHRHHYNTIVNAGFVKGLNQHEKNDIVRIGKEFFGPNYSPDMWCGVCIFEAVQNVYRAFDKHINEK